MKTSGLLSTFYALLILTGISVQPASAAGCAHSEFAAARAFPWNGYPASVAVANFNGDGFADVATANFLTNTVSVALSNGDGTLQDRIEYPATDLGNLLLASDMNSDGKVDLVIAGNSVAVLLGNGNGTFQTNFNLTGIGGNDLAIGDVNNDGTNDIATAGSVFASVNLGKGDLTFGTSVVYQVSFVGGGTAVALADLNADGKLDLVVGASGTSSGQLLVFLGNGDGNFQTNIITSTTTNNNHLAAADFNGDGTNDVASFDSVHGVISIYLSGGDGSLQLNATYQTGNPGPILSSITATDLNHDDRPDLVVGDFQTFVLLSNGDGTFQPPVKYEEGGIGVGIGDVNGDTIPDLVASLVGLAEFPNLWLLLGNGDGSFEEAPDYATGRGPLTPAIGNFNSDGKPDLATPNAFTNTISVLLNNGDGTYGTNVNYVTGNAPQSIVVGDFNNDTKLDLLVAHLNANNISLLLGNGNGTFQTNVNVASLIIGVGFVLAGDFNHDNKLDFAVPGIFGLDVYRGNGNGTFQAALTSSSAFLLDRAALGDFNNDNNLDIVLADYGTNTVEILLGNANGTFQPPVTNSAGTNVQSVAVGDLNGDGKLDIAVADFGCNPCGTSYPRGSISVLLGNGNGTFQNARGYLVDASMGAYSVAIGDVNGDGKPDLIAGDFIRSTVWILLNNGDGTFQPGVAFGAEAAPGFVAVADVDVDGHPDVLVANQTADTISVLVNTCSSNAPGGLIVGLGPALATNTVGTAHTVVALVASNAIPVSGATVNFSIVSGPNAGSTNATKITVSGIANFTYTGNIVGTDIIRAVSGNATGTATKVWIAAGPNEPPVALCRDITTNANASCVQVVPAIAVDNGSSDPDGNIVARDLNPPGPYAKGVTGVTLTVTDNDGATNSCHATITVFDQMLPVISCPGNIVTNVGVSGTEAVVDFTVPATDNCGAVSTNCVPPSGSTFPLGTNAVVCTAIDAAGNTNTCTFNVIVVQTPPVPHDFAVNSIKAPKKITLTATRLNVIKPVKIQIQNLGAQTETIPDANTLLQLVDFNVESLGACPVPAMSLVPPKSGFPLVLAPKKKLNLAVSVTFNCANDPLATTKTVNHSDFRYSVTVNPTALDGNPDVMPANDICPRPPSGADKGCGGKTSSGTLGGDVLTDVIVK